MQRQSLVMSCRTDGQTDIGTRRDQVSDVGLDSGRPRSVSQDARMLYYHRRVASLPVVRRKLNP
jgi:hypothetical protein